MHPIDNCATQLSSRYLQNTRDASASVNVDSHSGITIYSLSVVDKGSDLGPFGYQPHFTNLGYHIPLISQLLSKALYALLITNDSLPCLWFLFDLNTHPLQMGLH
jgi:hypothetical protein